MSGTLCFATEASHAVGLGHFMRCYALAEEAGARGLRSHFVVAALPEAARQRLQALGASWEEAGTGLEAACLARRLTPKDWWVADSYHLEAPFLAHLQARGRLMVFDDLCALPQYACEIIVNASPAAVELPYAARGRARRLLGPAYSPVRREFRLSGQAGQVGHGQGIAVMLGGSDPRGLTLQLAACLRRLCPEQPLHLILGPAFQDPADARREAARLGGVTVHQNPPDLARVLASAALVVTAAGGSVGELCAMGQVALALVVVDNQAAALAQCPYPVLDARQGLPEPDLAAALPQALGDDAWRRQVSAQAHALVDGLGCARILDAMLGL